MHYSRRRVLAAVSLGLAGCNSPVAPTSTTSPASTTGAETTTTTDVATTTVTPTSPTETTATSEAEPAPASVRVTHLSPDASALDVTVGGSTLVSARRFGTTTEYVEAPAGTATVAVADAATGDPLLRTTVGLRPTAQTLAVLGEATAGADVPLAVGRFVDDLGDPGQDRARLRVVHAIPDAPSVSVTAGGRPLASALGYGEATTSLVPGGELEFEARPTGGGSPLATMTFIARGRGVYTVWLAGYLTPEDEPRDRVLTVSVVQDAQIQTVDD